jgi:anaerobic selenocysteine-containing dehydrogenase
MKLKRRTFLKFCTVSTLSNLFLPNAFAKSRRSKSDEPYWVPRVGRYANTICDECSSGCGMRVKRVEKNAVKLEGNPDFPLNQGTLCTRGQAALQSLYNPDRIKAPLKRTGKRGSNQWKEIGWDEALAEVSKRLQSLRTNGKPHSLSLLTGRLGEGTPFLIERFLKTYGSPNLIWCPSLSNESVTRSHYLMDGNEGYNAYDFTNTQYLITFGDVLLQSPSHIHLLNSLKHLRFERPGKRAKLLAIDSRLSTTAAKADEWIPIKPGTEGALALGIAHVLIKENIYNRSFVEKHTFGFEDWEDEEGEKHTGFKNMVLKEYSPAQVSSITGITADIIIRLAKEISSNLPALALCSNNSYFYSNGVFNAMACHSLNALVGSINMPGGILFQKKPPLTSFPLPEADTIAQQGLSMPRIDGAGDTPFPLASHAAVNFPKAVLAQTPYPLDTLMIYHTNPLFKRADSESYKRAFEKIPFIVNFTPFMDETAHYSDLILPDSTFLERWESTSVSSSLGRAAFGVRQPVVAPLYNTLNTGDLIIKLAKKMGKPLAAAFPWEDSEHLIKERIRGIQESGKGSVVSAYSKKFWKKLLEKGGWWETDYHFDELDKTFKTPSKKFEFFSQIMKTGVEKLSAEEKSSALITRVKGDQKFMPHYEPPRYQGREKKFPLILIPFPTASLGSGGGANKPYLQEIFGGLHRLTWESWVEINPELAGRLNIKDHDQVWIESSRGKFRTLAKIYPGAFPDIICMPLGQGHNAYGRYARGMGINPLSLIDKDFDSLSGAQVLTGTRVNIYKA